MSPAKTDKRVAVLGASGIGKHHAKWWALEGADVCAIAGTSEASVCKTAAGLQELFGFSGRGYGSVEALLERERPGIVDVCTPPSLHFEHCSMSLKAGCHVLCEKPLVHDASLGGAALMDQAHELYRLAEERGLLFGVCTQYSTGARRFLDLWTKRHPQGTLHKFTGHLESPARGHDPDPRRIWADLSPHAISMLLEVIPGAAIQWDTLRIRFDGYEARADLTALTQAGAAVQCTLIARNTLQPPRNVRRCILNGYAFDVEGATNEQGQYCADIRTRDGSVRCPDMMHQAIGDFLRGRPPATKQNTLANMDIMLHILESAGGTPAQ
ncbi:MAG: Gfo/Idh/MocA family oxidoreductase [Candidatus Hydrogenedentes bacterium]|nr:Gfo/Idh/MocA family oxidoreductase [Candidatus Hydrogenedentota bacterium]